MSLTPGQSIAGFTLVSRDELPDFRSVGYWFRHSSGLELYFAQNSDPDKMFAFSFKTQAEGSTGVAHILEHSVLCGSEDYPLKDPFIQLSKGSLNTYLNAWTFSDKTVYPGSSTIKNDLFNLMKVYGDAVFRPLIHESIFRQEGHHIAQDEQGQWTYSGVVFNEMKGAYSSQESVISQINESSVFDSGPYRGDSGGDPLHIVDLSYEDFLRFHRDHYHLKNCQMVLYGDLDLEETLTFIEREILPKGSSGRVKEPLTLQKRWDSPRHLQTRIPGSDDDLGNKTCYYMNWLGPSALEPEEKILWDILSSILVGNAGLLSRKLLDSPLCEDIAPATGFMTHHFEGIFSVGIRGKEDQAREQFQQLLFSSLKGIQEEGVDPKLIESLIISYEFGIRELKGTGTGLRMLIRLLDGWNYGLEPLPSLEFSAHLDSLKERLKKGEKVFENMIEKDLLNNSHRVLLELLPDAQYSEKREEILRRKLQDRMVSWKEQDFAEQEKYTQELKKFQQTPDSPHLLATLPFLTLQDVPKSITPYGLKQEQEFLGAQLFSLPQPTNGIDYTSMVFTLGDLEEEELLLVSLYKKAVFDLGNKNNNYMDLDQKIKTYTGGISLNFGVEDIPGKGTSLLLYLGIGALEECQDQAWDLLKELIVDQDFSLSSRMGELIDEYRNELMSSLSPEGIHYAMAEVAGNVSARGKISWYMSGTPLWNFAKALKREDSQSILQKLKKLSEKIWSGANRWVAFSGEGNFFARGKERLKSFFEALPSPTPGQGRAAFSLEPRNKINYSIPATVGFVSCAFQGLDRNHPDDPAQRVITSHLSGSYLWEKVRMMGGAYGAWCSVLGNEGVFVLGTYRDPQWKKSLESLLNIFSWLRENPLEGRELEKTIMGLLSGELYPLSPREKTARALRSHIFQQGDEVRQERLDKYLSLTGEDIKRAGEWLKASMERKNYCVSVSPEVLLDQELVKKDNWILEKLL